jgi:glycosyltransferase involved in cell wall biosynthesis
MNNNNQFEISVCIIAKNEENHIKDCILSFRDYVEEIIVVDTGSTDDTLKIAKELNVNLYQTEWEDDFAKARNFSFDKATKDLIMFIDCDERLVNPEQLKSIKRNSTDASGGWIIDLVSENDKKGGSKDTFHSALLRIVKNHPKIRFDGAIHEQILDPILELGLKIENSGLQFYHHGYNLGPEKMKEKQLRNLRILEKELEKTPSDSHYLHHYGKTLLALGDRIKGLEYLEKAINNSSEESAVHTQSLNFASIAAFQLKQYEKAESYAKRSLEVVENQAFANYVLGEIANEKHDFEESLLRYEIMYKNMQNPSSKAKIIGDYHLPLEQIYFRFGRAKVALQRYDDAEKDFLKATQINPNISNNIIGLANVNFNKGNLERARELLIEALEKDGNEEQIHQFLNEVDKVKERQSVSQNIIEKEQEHISIHNVRDLKNYYKSKPVTKNPKNENDVNIKSSEKPLLTLSMIVKNEEESLPKCLGSVRDLVDEIIIVDTGSTDNTVQIARSYGAKIHHFEWINDFAAARNEALKHSHGEWILYLDADERIKPTDFKKLREMLKVADSNLGAIICTIESDHSNLNGASELHRGGYPRLFKNLGYPKIHFTGRVHEQISPAIQEAGLGMSRSDIVIIHDGYNRPREEMEQKLQRNYKLLLEHVREEPTNGYAWYQLGQTLAQMNIKEKAEEAILFAVKCGNLSDSVYASAASTLSQFAGQKKDFESALDWAEKSLEKAPNQVYGLNLKAHALLFMNRKSEAKEFFKKSLEILDNQKGVPQSGFDIMIDRNVILNGLKKAES